MSVCNGGFGTFRTWLDVRVKSVMRSIAARHRAEIAPVGPAFKEVKRIVDGGTRGLPRAPCKDRPLIFFDPGFHGKRLSDTSHGTMGSIERWQDLEHDPEKHALGLDPRVGTGFPSRQTRSVCAEIMLKQKDRAE